MEMRLAFTVAILTAILADGSASPEVKSLDAGAISLSVTVVEYLTLVSCQWQSLRQKPSSSSPSWRCKS